MAELDAFVRLSTALTGLTDTELPAAVEQRDTTGGTVPLSQVYLDRLRKASLCLRLQRGCGVWGWGPDGLGTGA